MPELPHFNLPFRFSNGAAVVVEQDSIEDAQNQVLAVVLTPKGFRQGLEEFGIVQPTFHTAPLDTNAIESAVAEWVPSVTSDVTEYGDLINEAIRTLRINLEI